MYWSFHCKAKAIRSLLANNIQIKIFFLSLFEIARVAWNQPVEIPLQELTR